MLNVLKVKSHITSDEEWQRFNMTAEGLVLNELADEAATIGKQKIARSTEAIDKDGKTHTMAYEIALRLAFIEAEIWRRTPEMRTKRGRPKQIG